MAHAWHPAIDRRAFLRLSAATALASTLPRSASAATDREYGAASGTASVDWERAVRTCRTEATVQTLASPLVTPQSPVREKAMERLTELDASYVRYLAWYGYPFLGVGELFPPTPERTSWTLPLVDQPLVDFIGATSGRQRIWSLTTTPSWMWRTDTPIMPPTNPGELDTGYGGGSALAVPVETVGRYYGQLAAWYAQGGFTDSAGAEHRSGYEYGIDVWEVFNEIVYEHELSAELYTELYDAIVPEVSAVSLSTEFMALALPGLSESWLHYFSYFLDRSNHTADVPLDWISYHFYADVRSRRAEEWAAPSFAQADQFLAQVDRVEAIRRRLAPGVRTAVDEVGSLLSGDNLEVPSDPVPSLYWNFAAALYTYVLAGLAVRGIDVACASALLCGPGFFPGSTMLDWSSGAPNARYRALQLVRSHLTPGVGLHTASTGNGAVCALGISDDRTHKLLLVNTGLEPTRVTLPISGSATLEVVDASTAGAAARRQPISGSVELDAFAVAVATIP